MPIDPIAQATEKVTQFHKQVEAKLQCWLEARSPESFRQMELDIARECRRVQDELTEVVLRSVVGDGAFQAETTTAARQGGRYRDGGRRAVTVRLLGGKEIRLEGMPYLKENRRRKIRGRPRQNRGKGSVALYPCLAALGIALGVTPALGGEICYQVAESESVRAGRAALARRDIDLGHKQTLRIVNAYGQRAVSQRFLWLQKALEQPPQAGPLAGCRVVVGTDGGRIRQRLYKRAGRRQTNGHRRYDTPWREPKLLVIYVIDDHGRVRDTYRPIYDGTLKDADGVMAMLLGYLKALGAKDAKDLIIVGDGAKWIWERAGDLVCELGIDRARVREVIDWYHATQTLHEIADLAKGLKGTERASWIKVAEPLLHQGKINKLVTHIEDLATGRRAKAVRSHIDYFARNETRMQYKEFRRMRIPCGSGAIESAMRRVVNLRLKSPGKFWKEENAEAMLLFRSYLRAGRFDDLWAWSISSAVPWYQPAAMTPLFPTSQGVSNG